MPSGVGLGALTTPLAPSWRYSVVVATIQVKGVPEDVHRILRTRAADAGQSLQRFMLDVLAREAQRATVLELLARRRIDSLHHPAHRDVDPEEVVALIRADRDSH